jgi:hypothetical protein
VGDYCRKMKSTADGLRDLGYTVPEHVLVLNILRGLPSSYEAMRTLLTNQQPPPTFLQVRDALTLEALTRGLHTPTSTTSSASSSTSRTLVVAPPPSSASPPASLLGAPPPRPSGGGGAVGATEAAEDAVVGVVGLLPRLRPLLLLLFLEVHLGRPSPTRGQGVSPCGPIRVKEGGLVPRTNRRPWS